MSFRVAVDLTGAVHAVVAETGVQWGTDGAYVWAVSDGKADRKPVRIIERREGHVLVEGDLASGDIVVVEGVQRMRDGIDLRFDMPQLADERLSQPAPANPAGEDSPATALN